MLESLNSTELKYTKLTPEEQESRGILGRLVGVIADFKKPTRNGRLYTEKLWDKLFSDPIMKERIDNRCCFGELGHPEDRVETDIEKIAICLAEMPKKDPKGRLQGVFDILNTPNGKILKTLCDYGCNIGVSSRGNGDIITDYSGVESVDPDTYTCEGWDAVLIPAVVDARPKYVSESLHNDSLDRALKEALSSSSADDRKIMESTLKELNIEVGTASQVAESIDVSNKSDAADDDGAGVIRELQESLKKNQEYEQQLKKLQESLSVCYTKESEQEAEIGRLRKMLKTAQEVANTSSVLNTKIKYLGEQLAKQKQQHESQQLRISVLEERLSGKTNRERTLEESYNSKKTEVAELQREIKSLKESISNISNKSTKQEQILTEQIEELKKDSSIKNSEYKSKLEMSNKLVEKYQRIAKIAVDKYISSQAASLGVSAAQIKNRLSENYSFEDIDKACAELSRYKVTISNLPFDLQEGISQGKMQVKKSSEPILPDYGLDDNVDDWLMAQATKK